MILYHTDFGLAIVRLYHLSNVEIKVVMLSLLISNDGHFENNGMIGEAVFAVDRSIFIAASTVVCS